MNQYDRIIFICKENSNLSPMAEWIFKSITMETQIEVLSRGLVVLFPEPYNGKIAEVLRLHGVPYEEGTSCPFDTNEVTEATLLITMSSTEKIKIVEEFQIEQNLYTLKEFVEEEGDVLDPYGMEEEGYEACYAELKDLLYKMKKKLDIQ